MGEFRVAIVNRLRRDGSFPSALERRKRVERELLMFREIGDTVHQLFAFQFLAGAIDVGLFDLLRVFCSRDVTGFPQEVESFASVARVLRSVRRTEWEYVVGERAVVERDVCSLAKYVP